MQRLLLLGLNHTTAPLDVRERLAFDAPQLRRAIELLRARFAESEAVLLSTCNRVELYVARPVHGHPRPEEMAGFLSEFHSVPVAQFKHHLYERTEREVVEHLFSVTASLDSMVLGESQILGQVRQAYDVSQELGATGTVLNPLFQRAIAVGRQVQSQTTLGNGRVSVSGVAVKYASQIFDHFNDKTVLCIGAGKMAALALKGFAALEPKSLVVCNRDIERANRIAAEVAGTGCAFDALDQQLVAADIVITSTGAAHPVITRKQFVGLLKLRRYRPIFIIDIAVPRDVEPGVGELEHVFLYNLDDLQKAVADTHTQRGDALDAARQIVRAHVEEFVTWQRQRELGPMIDQLYRRLHEMAAEEVGRTLNKMPSLDAGERAQLEELARRIVNKLLHEPVKRLREGGQLHAPAGQYLHAIQQLFKLNEGSGDESASAERTGEAD
jgi:glutamyl-tRNA reductase